MIAVMLYQVSMTIKGYQGIITATTFAPNILAFFFADKANFMDSFVELLPLALF